MLISGSEIPGTLHSWSSVALCTFKLPLVQALPSGLLEPVWGLRVEDIDGSDLEVVAHCSVVLGLMVPV